MNNDWKVFLDKLDFRFRKRVPVIHQTESSECGLVCLAMVCDFYGKSVNMVSLRQDFNLSSRGATLAEINDIANQLGMTTRPLSLDLDEISSLKTPCILHWGFNHFVVLVSNKNNQFLIHDPARGHRKVSREELSKFFTGIALEVWPGNDFVAENKKTVFSLFKLIGSVKGLKGALTKIFLFSLIIETINLLIPVGTQLVMDHAVPAGDLSMVTLICLGLMFFILLRTTLSVFRSWTNLVMGALIDIQWQSGLFKHLLNLPLTYFERRKLGDIQSRFSSLNVLRTTFTTNIVGAIMDGIMIIGVLTMMIIYGGFLSVVVVGFSLIYILIRLGTFHRYRNLSEEMLIREARAHSYFMESLYGIATLKMQGMVDRRGHNWINLKVDSVNTGINITKMDLFFGGLNSFLVACEQIAILWMGISSVIGNQMTIGMFVAFGIFRSQFSERMSSLTNFMLELRMMSLHNERISDIALNETEVRKRVFDTSKKIESASLLIDGLSYRYDSQSPRIFTGLNLTIAAGESVGIIGPSGSGKTTLMKIMCGLFDPESGKIIFDGMDISQLGLNNYRKMISCVMQDDKLFSGSIRDNLCGFAPDIDEDWMIECAKVSYIHDVIISMPMGYETLMGELGEGLSGGQKQRLFIARALYRKPRILFMDEATSALDSESEKFVNDAIQKLNITRIVIAHRKSTIRSLGRIIELN